MLAVVPHTGNKLNPLKLPDGRVYEWDNTPSLFDSNLAAFVEKNEVLFGN